MYMCTLVLKITQIGAAHDMCSTDWRASTYRCWRCQLLPAHQWSYSLPPRLRFLNITINKKLTRLCDESGFLPKKKTTSRWTLKKKLARMRTYSWAANRTSTVGCCCSASWPSRAPPGLRCRSPPPPPPPRSPSRRTPARSRGCCWSRRTSRRPCRTA